MRDCRNCLSKRRTMSSERSVVFKRGVTPGDVWDDGPLIDEYDASMKAFRTVQLGGSSPRAKYPPSGSSDDEADKRRAAGAPKSKSSTSKKLPRTNADLAQQSKASAEWAVGDKCSCVYSGDGKRYNAEIVSVDMVEGLCTVQYVGYDTTEPQHLNQLRPFNEALNADAEPAPGADASPKHSKPGKRAKDVPLPDSPPMPDADKPPKSGLKKKDRLKAALTNGQFDADEAAPEAAVRKPLKKTDRADRPPKPPKAPPMLNGLPAFASPSAALFAPAGHLPPFNGAIPSPSAVLMPPPSLSDHLGNPDAPLNSMLMSWYMSGYHTGYFQGLRDAARK